MFATYHANHIAIYAIEIDIDIIQKRFGLDLGLIYPRTMGRGFPPALTSPPACRPPPLHKWRGGGRDARHVGRYGFGEGGEETPATAGVIGRGGVSLGRCGRGE